MANNLRISCSNHFRKRPYKPSDESQKFCTCFAGDFTSTLSLRDLDIAGGTVTPEIQDQFERSAEVCGRDVSASVAEAGRAWALDSN